MVRKRRGGREKKRRSKEKKGENRRGGRGVKKHISLLCVYYAIVWCSISGQPMSFDNGNVL